jgi:exosortase family protein XrtM
MSQPRPIFAYQGELRFALAFLLTFCMLHFAWQLGAGGMAEHLAIDIATVYPSTAAINLIDAGQHAVARDHHILSPQGSLSILNGCEGTETLFLLIAAIAAFRGTLKNKLRGMLLGAMLVYVLNQVRIVTLFFAAHESRTGFDLIHGYLAPGLIIALSSLYFLWWAGTTIAAEPATTA